MHEFLWNNIKQQNRNGLLTRDPTVDGLKTGHTDSAGFCLVTSAKRDNMRLISVVMGSPSVKAREDASAALLNYGYTFYETTQIKKAREAVLKPRVFKSSVDFATVGVANDIIVTVGRGQAAGSPRQLGEASTKEALDRAAARPASLLVSSPSPTPPDEAAVALRRWCL